MFQQTAEFEKWYPICEIETIISKTINGPMATSVKHLGKMARNQRRTNNYDLKQGQLCRDLASRILVVAVNQSILGVVYMELNAEGSLCYVYLSVTGFVTKLQD